MFLMFDVIEYPEDERIPEICTFRGIRYDKESKIAILSTEHDNHDYLMPVPSTEAFRYMTRKFYKYLSKAILKPGLMVAIGGSPVYRVEHGSYTRIANTEDYKYTVKALHEDVTFNLGKLFKKEEV